MTITTDVNKFRYQGNGVTDTFAFNARIFSVNDIAVQIITRATDVLVETLTITTDYTVTINGDETASVVVVAGKIPSALQDIQIIRQLPKTQTADLPTGTVFPAVTVENGLDKVTAIAQDLSEQVDRAIKLPETSSLSNVELPAPTASNVIGWNATGDNLANYDFNVFGDAIDITTASLADNDILQYNSSLTTWENIGQQAFTNNLTFQSGSAASPSVTFAGDTDTGFYRVGSNEIGVAVNGSKVAGIGTTGIDTSENIKFTANVKGFVDSNGNELLLFGSNASAVNYIQMSNASTGNAVTIAPLGDDTDVGLRITPKGNGNLAVTSKIDATGFSVGSLDTVQELQQVEYSDAVYSSTPLNIPFDDTPPAITDGEISANGSFTPKSASSKIEITWSIPLDAGAGVHAIAAVFRSGQTDCLDVDAVRSNNVGEIESLGARTVTINSWGTSAETISIRYGASSGTCYKNGINTGRKFGGTMAARITIREIL